MGYDCKHVPYWIDRGSTCFAGPAYAASISFGLPFEPEDCQYGKVRIWAASCKPFLTEVPEK